MSRFMTRIDFHDLSDAELVLEREYAGGRQNNAGDDPIAVLLPVGNQGGFRYNGSVQNQDVRLVVLYTSGADPDWPDTIDPETGDFTYYGDNKKPGHKLHDTQRQGNALLRDIFAWGQDPEQRFRVPPIFLFQKSGRGRDVKFRGLIAPGSPRLSSEEELVAVWRTTQAHRFQNYRAHFTILDQPAISREWVSEVLSGEPLGTHAPKAWVDWVRHRKYHPLLAPRTLVVRSKEDQYPRPSQMAILQAVHKHFSPDPIRFEYFAADTWVAMDPHVTGIDVTRPSRDGGRDAVGAYSVGPTSDPVRMHFALEAKCLAPEVGSVSTKMVSRLISRIKHREFGVLVTTAHIGAQPYEEVRSDGHPIVFITGRDIVEALSRRGLRTVTDVRAHLEANYPVEAATSPQE